eukprot:2008291-Pleurochrysis_carterae.AAC.2
MPRTSSGNLRLGQVNGTPLQRSTLMKEYVGYPLRPDRMHPIRSYVLRGAGCHGSEDHDLYGATRHICLGRSTEKYPIYPDCVHSGISPHYSSPNA